MTASRSLGLATLVVRDYDEAFALRRDLAVFDEPETEHVDEERDRFVVVAPEGGAGLLLARASTPEQAARVGDQTGGRVAFFLETEDFARDHAAYRAAGVRFAEAPRHEPYGTVAVFLDLYGNRWDLLEKART